MSDKELLELAAKAAGLKLVRWNDGVEPYSSGHGFFLESGRMWNPLKGAGDNRLLQIQLRVGLVPVDGGGWACVTWDHDDEVTLAADFDPNRAIVRAAAEIGKSMQP